MMSMLKSDIKPTISHFPILFIAGMIEKHDAPKYHQ